MSSSRSFDGSESSIREETDFALLPHLRSSAGLSPNDPGPSYVCALCPLGNSLFCRHGKNSAATPLAGTGLREASLGKNDNGCLFIVTEMCGVSDMKQRRPLAAAEAAAAGTWFQNLSRSAEAVLAEFTPALTNLASKVAHTAPFTSNTTVEKSFRTPCAFLTYCIALRFSLWSPSGVYFGRVANLRTWDLLD